MVNFDPTLGAEIRKTRPALILQNDIANKFSPVTIVAAISSKFDDPLYPTEVLISAKARTGIAASRVCDERSDAKRRTALDPAPGSTKQHCILTKSSPL